MTFKTVVVNGPASSTQAQQQLQQQVQIFPNPTREYVQLAFQFDALHSVEYRVVDLLGKTYLTGQPGRIREWNESLDIRTLPPGTYLLMVYADGVAIGKRLVKL
jgi:hypothetical protein